jgi:integrase
VVKLREATKSGWKSITPSEPAENIYVPVKRTILLSMGVSAKVVQQILGHSTISTTLNIYGHVLPEMHCDAMEKMDDFFGGE